MNRDEQLRQTTFLGWQDDKNAKGSVIERVVILARGGPLRFQLQEPAANSPKETVVVPATQKEWLESQRASIKTALEKNLRKRWCGRVAWFRSEYSIFTHCEVPNQTQESLALSAIVQSIRRRAG
jgi:hypothetical protein